MQADFWYNLSLSIDGVEIFYGNFKFANNGTGFERYYLWNMQAMEQVYFSKSGRRGKKQTYIGYMQDCIAANAAYLYICTSLSVRYKYESPRVEWLSALLPHRRGYKKTW